MSKQLYAPNGKRIIGTVELIPGCALVSEWPISECEVRDE